MKITLHVFIFILSGLLYIDKSHAEAWISNRYAQNCASCHSPSRRNIKLEDRRCTLACQGCHVNPNGGGLRNQYGIWNQQRWLRSFQSESLTKWLRKEPLPAPLSKQKYAKQPEKLSKTDIKKRRRYLSKGSSLASLQTAEYREKDYDRSDKQEHIEAQSMAEFLERVTDEDPLREERRLFVYGGGDMRFFYLSKTHVNDKSTFFPMAFDMGLRIRPTREHVSFVTEARFRNGPYDEGLDQQFEEASVKSAYVLVDDLPFATYVMYGIYRPLFGHYTADHESLTQRLIGFGYDTKNHAISVGGSPNVPFINLHAIMPSTSDKINKDSGFAVNLGARWVTLGASLMLSYWDTKNKSTGVNKKMYSGNIGGKWDIPGTNKFLVLNADLTSFDIENSSRRDKGVSFTNEFKLNLWRENYLVLNYANSNVAENRERGKSTEYAVGIKSFLIAGTEFELLSVHRESTSEENSANTYTDDVIQGQIHLYF